MADPQLQEEHTTLDSSTDRSASIQKLSSESDKQKEKKENFVADLQRLQEKINEMEGGNGAVQKLLPLLESLKVLERQESVLQFKKSQLQAEVDELEGTLANACDSETVCDYVDRIMAESLEKLNSAKKELAATLRTVVALKRQFDEIPIQSELIQYERRLSELNIHIQEKHRQTRKYYATYNALLEIKELMIKETSLLNSMSSQFQDAITSTDGRMKLINSIEGIVKGSEQKLQKVQLGLQEEQKTCDSLKKRYVAAMAEQRRCYSLLKALQEECARNERLRNRKSV